MSTTHKQAHIQHGEIEADVDERIAPLIVELWRAGVTTRMSCQEFGEYDGPPSGVWIVFPTESDVKQVAKILRGGRTSFDIRAVTVTPEDDPDQTMPAGSVFWHWLFPRRDYKAVLARVRKYNARNS